MRYACILAALILACALPIYAADPPKSGKADYAYFDGDPAHPERQRLVVIGMNFLQDATKTENCQTRTCVDGKVSDWRSATSIIRAEDDEYRFSPQDRSNADGVVEVQVKGPPGRPSVASEGWLWWARRRSQRSSISSWQRIA